MQTAQMAAQVKAMLDGASLVSSGLDWITCTTDLDQGYKHIRSIFERVASQRERLGDKPKAGGFQGYAGHSCGPVFLGKRDDGALLKVSGEVAGNVWPAINHDLVHFTRLDQQATVRLVDDFPELAQVLADLRYAQWYENRPEPRKETDKIKPKQRHEGGYGEGDTLYIGSRGSPRFGRVYDKAAESGDAWFERCWRFEVEFKRVMAPLVADVLRGAPNPQELGLSILKGQFEDWGIQCPVNATELLVAGSIGRREPDNDRSLAWLRDQVSPTVERLLGSMDVTDVLMALNITDAVLAQAGKVSSPRREQLIAAIAQRRQQEREIADEIPF